MSDYLVALRPSVGDDKGRRGRAEVLNHNLSRTTSFRSTLEGWLNQHGLTAQVAGIGEPTGFPVLTLTCTSQVASAIAGLPEVESVVADDDFAMRIIS